LPLIRITSISRLPNNGLTSSADFGAVCSFPSQTVPGTNYPCVFPGINPNAPPLSFLKPIGRSVYNGLQVKLTQNLERPFRSMSALNLQCLTLYQGSKMLAEQAVAP